MIWIIWSKVLAASEFKKFIFEFLSENLSDSIIHNNLNKLTDYILIYASLLFFLYLILYQFVKAYN